MPDFISLNHSSNDPIYKMKRISVSTLLTGFTLCSSLLLHPASLSSQHLAKPVRATWINFEYQDERNKYMNPFGTDMTNPELWKTKMSELNEFGIKYVILMYVANNGRSFYNSNFMPHAYKDGIPSPVDVIMKSADELGMKVFMSSGWAKDQDDNPALPEIRSVQLKIMKETADLYSKHKSFYGWYLPCEDVVGPFLSERAVNAANELASEARKLTPGAKVMISPYGLRMAKFDDGRFAEQIAKLKVDIIAYQDEIGCVVEDMPIPHLKENFMKLREVHDKAGIAFWSNNEAFTWEKGLNTRPSALIPAPFPRYLSQICGASAAKVDEVSSFAICGIFDKPGSAFPIGEPELSRTAWKDYMDWLSGKGRWSILEATFLNLLSNEAKGMTVTFTGRESASTGAGLLTDGKFGVESTSDKNWVINEKGDLIFVVDMKKEVDIRSVATRFLTYRKHSIAFPSTVEFSFSADWQNFTSPVTVRMDNYLPDRYDCWIDLAYSGPITIRSRYIRVYCINSAGMKIMCDEVIVNPSTGEKQ